jgi:hypothetical protein
MSLLRSLACAYCNWAGSAVSTSSLDAFSQLQSLDVRGNRFSTPTGFLASFTTTSVRYLYVSSSSPPCPGLAGYMLRLCQHI